LEEKEMSKKMENQKHAKKLSLLLVVAMLSFAALPIVSLADEQGDAIESEYTESSIVTEEDVTTGESAVTQEAIAPAEEEQSEETLPVAPVTSAGIKSLAAVAPTATDLHRDAEVHVNNAKDLLDVLGNGVANKVYLAAGNYQLASGLIGNYNAGNDSYETAGYTYSYGYPRVTRSVELIAENGEASIYNNPGYRHLFLDGDIAMSFENVKLVGNNGGGIYNGMGTLTLNNAVITGCTANDSTRGTYDGGAVKSLGTYLVLNNCTFEGNTGNWGGAVYAQAGATANNCTFTNNTAKDATNTYNGYGGAIAFGGKLEVIGGTMSGNYADVMGGAIARPYSAPGSIMEGHVKGVKFENNTTNGNGGAIASITTKGFVVEDCTFIGNKAMVKGGIGNGGAVFATSIGDMTIKNSTMTGNSGYFGGAVAMDGPGNLVIENSSISGNAAKDVGGGVSAHNNGTVTLTNVSLKNNSVQGSNLAYGGGLYLANKSGAVITGSEIANNTAVCGGGAYIESKGNVDFTNTDITANSAESAGGLYSGEFEATNTVTMNGGSIKNNTADTLGGGWFVYDANAVANGTKIEGNTAAGNGGGLYVFLGSISLLGATLSDNEADYGGGAYVSNYTNYDVELNLTDTVVSGNKATYAAGVVTFGPLNALRTNFTDNVATNFAGAIMSDGGGSVTLKDSTVKENKADLVAGIYATHLDKLTTKNVTFSENDSRLGYAWRLDKADASDTFANLHTANILNTTYTAGYTNAYNNIDVYFTRANVNLTYKQNVADVAGSGTQTTAASPTYNNEQSIDLITKPYMAVTLKAARDVKDWIPSGKRFMGWSTERDGAVLNDLVMPQKDVTLYAIWDDLPVVPEPEITPDPDPETPPTPQPPVVTPPTPQPPVTPPTPDPVTIPPTLEPTEIPPAHTTPMPNPTSVIQGFSERDQEKLDAQTGNIWTDISNGNVPLGTLLVDGVWSLLNLLLALIALVVSIIVSVKMVYRRRDQEDRQNQRKRGILMGIGSVIFGLLTGILFILLEDMTLPMVWINKWTLVIGIAFIVHISCIILRRLFLRRDKETFDTMGEAKQIEIVEFVY
jgi:hypothetical protein